MRLCQGKELTVKMALTINLFLIALSVVILQVNGGLIGSCDKAIISSIMSANSQNCPSNILQTIYEKSPTVMFRVIPTVLASESKCILGVLQEPENNVFDFDTTARFKNESLPQVETTFVMTESTCGLMFKHVVEENYSTFILANSYFDGISLGYYGCSNDCIDEADDFTYVICLSVINEDEDLTTASVAQCKQHMIAMTGSTDVVELDPELCKEYLT